LVVRLYGELHMIAVLLILPHPIRVIGTDEIIGIPPRKDPIDGIGIGLQYSRRRDMFEPAE